MKITIAAIGSARARQKSEVTEQLVADYLHRCCRYLPCEQKLFEEESALFASLDQSAGRTPAQVVLMESRGQMLTSEEFAEHLRARRDSGLQRLVVAIGPADGWSAPARARANLLVSLGRMTLPHGLAKVVLAEQVYRALTILAGHPYHSAHL